MMSSFWGTLSRDAHTVSKYSGDINAYQTGGLPRLAKRVTRRRLTRAVFRWFR